jgi:hypothetical protein
MRQLPDLKCPKCGSALLEMSIDSVPRANSFDDCLRRCEPCGIGVSNSSDAEAATYIFKDPLQNIPVESRSGAIEALEIALNVRNRISKIRRFGFSSSEDAVTWVVFTHLRRVGLLRKCLSQVGVQSGCDDEQNVPALLLWGVPIESGSIGGALRDKLVELCVGLGERRVSFSEPDVIVDLGKAGLLFIEVKYRSGNDSQSSEYAGWSKYDDASWLSWNFEKVKESGCYELARNWCLMKGLAGDRPCTLVSLGPEKLFSGSEGRRLDKFVDALDVDQSSRFAKIVWSEFLEDCVSTAPAWFERYCRGRGLC